MAGVSWIFTVFCVAGCLASPVLRSAHVVQVGQNVTLTCNLTQSGDEVTWYLLRSERLVPLLTLRRAKIDGHDTTDAHAADATRFSAEGDLGGGSVSLEVLEVQEQDAGLYFCSGRSHQTLRVDRGTHLTVTGADGRPVGDGAEQPCWYPGICVVPGIIAAGVVLIAGLIYLCTGKPDVCSCNSWGGGVAATQPEDGCLLYSSVKLSDRPCRSVTRRQPDVTYSMVTTHRNQ